MTTNYIILQNIANLTIIVGVSIFLIITLLLVIILLIAKKRLVNTGKISITINDDTKIETNSGKSLLSTLADENIYLPSACGGKGSCAQCKVQVTEGGGDILPTEQVHFSRREQKEHWRLGCQVKVKDNIKISVPSSVLNVKEWECEVISNKKIS